MNFKTSKKRVAVIFGGVGPEHSVSVEGADFLVSVLERTEYVPIPVYVSRSGKWQMFPRGSKPSKIAEGGVVGIKTFPVRLGCKSGFLICGGVLPVFAAIPLMHGDGGEDGTVAGALSLAGIDYVGADTVGSALSFNKAYAKAIAESVGIPTLPWLYFSSSSLKSESPSWADDVEEGLGYPVFVKPATLGSSVGCAPARERQELVSAVCAASKLSCGVLVERMLEAPRELEVAYFGTKSKEIFTKPGEIFCKSGFYSYEEKYSEQSQATVLTSADISSAQGELLREYSRALVHALGIRHLCRIDFFLGGGKIYFNEINTIPGMTRASLYPAMLSASGVSHEDMAIGLIESAVAKK